MMPLFLKPLSCIFIHLFTCASFFQVRCLLYCPCKWALLATCWGGASAVLCRCLARHRLPSVLVRCVCVWSWIWMKCAHQSRACSLRCPPKLPPFAPRSLTLCARTKCVLRACCNYGWRAEYDIVSLCLVSFYCFVTKACARRPGLPQACHSGSLACRPCKQGTALTSPSLHACGCARPSRACTFSADHK